jgi:iron-regulated transporter 1
VATIANLASVGSKIVLEKDWIVVIAMDDQERLAKMNAVFRTVDLVQNMQF